MSRTPSARRPRAPGSRCRRRGSPRWPRPEATHSRAMGSRSGSGRTWEGSAGKPSRRLRPVGWQRPRPAPSRSRGRTHRGLPVAPQASGACTGERCRQPQPGSREPGVPEAARARPLAAGSRLRLELRRRPELGPQRLRRRRSAPPNLSTYWRGLPDRPARRRSLRAAGRSAEELRGHDILRGRRRRPATAAPTSAHARSGPTIPKRLEQRTAHRDLNRCTGVAHSL